MIDLESTIRTSSTRETLARIAPLAWKQFGITRVANITGLDNIGIPVYVSIRPNSKSLSVSQGKGVSDDLAKISAMMESIETWHAENIDANKIILTDSHQNLKKDHPVVDPNLFITNDSDLTDTILDWLEVTELFSGQKAYLPQKLYSLDMTKLDEISQQFSPSSNGLASGNNYEEALCHSLCELIERDAVVRWMHLSESEQDQQLVDPNSITDPVIKKLIEKISAAKLNLYIWNIENHLGVPAYYCVITDHHKQPFTLFTGSGAHYTDKVALIRAITEAAQARLTYISGSRDDVFPDYYQNFDPSEVVVELQTSKATAKYNPKDPAPFSSFAEINTQLLEKLSSQNISNIYVFNHTRPELDIAVVHALSPDLLSEK